MKLDSEEQIIAAALEQAELGGITVLLCVGCFDQKQTNLPQLVCRDGCELNASASTMITFYE